MVVGSEAVVPSARWREVKTEPGTKESKRSAAKRWRAPFGQSERDRAVGGIESGPSRRRPREDPVWLRGLVSRCRMGPVRRELEPGEGARSGPWGEG